MRHLTIALAATAAAAAGLAGCGGGTSSGAPTTALKDARRPPASGAIVAALAPLPGGGLRVGELTTGVIRDAYGARGRPAARDSPSLTRVSVSTGGQRGLLGLVVDRRGRTFAAFTAKAAPQRLVVEQVLPGPHRRVWTGPPSTDLADGGHLDVAPDGHLLIGIGDLQAPQRIPDDDAPNGKLLALDPSGPATQRPRILSRGWNNPFAFAVVPGSGGEVLVADNAPGKRPERIARGDAGGGSPRAVTDLLDRMAPSGLVALGADDVLVCGVRSAGLRAYHRGPRGWQRVRSVPETPCAFGVARLTDGRIVTSTAEGLRVTRAASPNEAATP